MLHFIHNNSYSLHWLMNLIGAWKVGQFKRTSRGSQRPCWRVWKIGLAGDTTTNDQTRADFIHSVSVDRDQMKSRVLDKFTSAETCAFTWTTSIIFNTSGTKLWDSESHLYRLNGQLLKPWSIEDKWMDWEFDSCKNYSHSVQYLWSLCRFWRI